MWELVVKCRPWLLPCTHIVLLSCSTQSCLRYPATLYHCHQPVPVCITLRVCFAVQSWCRPVRHQRSSTAAHEHCRANWRSMTAARNINLDVLEVSSRVLHAGMSPASKGFLLVKTDVCFLVQTSSLERYYRTFKLSDSPIYSRDELVPLVVQHLTELVGQSLRFQPGCTSSCTCCESTSVCTVVRCTSAHSLYTAILGTTIQGITLGPVV
jgi:hypothetical protein